MDVDSFYNDQSDPAARSLPVVADVAVAYHAVSARKVSAHCGHHNSVFDSYGTYAAFPKQMRVLHVLPPGLTDKAFVLAFVAQPQLRKRPILVHQKSGSVAEFVGKRAVEKAAAWKSPPAGLSPSA
jgi:hypothetical protein